jgi:hypothetical protein
MPLPKYRDPIEWPQQSLEVTNPKDSEILRVSLAPGAGLSGADRAAIINAAVRSDTEEVVNAELGRRTERLDRLQKMKERQTELLQKKRAALRKLSKAEGGEHLAGLEKEAWPRLCHDLRTPRVKLRLERAEVETFLERRKKAERAAADASARRSRSSRIDSPSWPPAGAR